jgi:hypothetical protein
MKTYKVAISVSGGMGRVGVAGVQEFRSSGVQELQEAEHRKQNTEYRSGVTSGHFVD